MSDNKRPNDILENYKAYKLNKNQQFAKFESANINMINKRASFIKEYNNIRNKREVAERMHGKMINEARDYYFANALKGIYIGALEANTLTDDALYLAENMVDTYMKDKGGYSNIISEAKVDTYLLAKIRRVVEDAAEEEVENLEKDSDDIEDIEDIKIEDEPEDEKDTTTVADGEEITTANITDIITALNQAGMEVVKKDDADNFKDEQPETDETSPETEIDIDTKIEDEPVDDTTSSEEPSTDVEPTSDNIETPEPSTEEPVTTTDAKPAEDTEEPSGAPSTDVEETNSTEDKPVEAEEEKPVEDTEKAEEKVEDDLDKTEEDEDELSADLAAAEENNKNKEEEFDDTMDPDSIKVNDEEESDNDSDLDDLDMDFGDEDDDSELEDDEDELAEEEDTEDIESSDDSEEASDEEPIDLDNDGDPDIGDIDEPEDTVNVDPNKTMMDELENEKEIKDAIELIRTRVADAEEAFIKRNQEDKQKMDDLLSKISHNVATVEKISTDDSEAAESTKKSMDESTIMFKKALNEIKDSNTNIFDKMTRNISESIIKDPRKVKMFINESTGNPDMTYIVETSKVIYTFLETLNTLQLEKIDGPYITKVINDIK